jgi:hypothetical protein
MMAMIGICFDLPKLQKIRKIPKQKLEKAMEKYTYHVLDIDIPARPQL